MTYKQLELMLFKYMPDIRYMLWGDTHRPILLCELFSQPQPVLIGTRVMLEISMKLREWN